MACCGGETLLSELSDLANQIGCCGGEGRQTLLTELKDMVNQIGGCSDPCCPPCTDGGGCCCPCCPPCNFPFAQVTMTCPPPVLAPTRPEPVKPLGIFCPKQEKPILTDDEREATRYDNFYNWYNLDWHNESPRYQYKYKCPECTPEKECGVTVDGKSPCCDECRPCEPCCEDVGCPTGFKPCTMRMFPPPCCDPCGVWCAQVCPCPPKKRKSPRFEVGAAWKKKNCS